MTKRTTIYLSIASVSFITMVAITFLFITMNSYYYATSSLETTNKIEETNKPIVIYFAKDSCPHCKKVDRRMILNRFKLKYPLYRIEVMKEKNQTELKKIFKENGIGKVPTFLKIEGNSTKIIQENELFE